MRAFITGATGFIGRRLVDRWCADEKQHAVCLVRPNTTGAWTDAVRAVHGYLSDSAPSLAASMNGCDIVFHLAGFISFNQADRAKLIQTNSDGAARVLEAAKMARVNRVVIVSSACTVGLSTRPEHVLNEDAPANAALARRNPYLHSKLLAERHAIVAADRGQHVVIVNPTTVFGPGDRGLNSGTLIRQVALGRIMPVPPGGSNVVDVDDVVEGIIAAGHRGVAGRRYILGGENLRFAEIVARISKVVGRAPWRVSLNNTAQWPMVGAAWLLSMFTHGRLITPQIISDTFAFKYYSSARAAVELHWTARRTFEDSVARACEYYRDERLISFGEGVAA